MFGEFYFAEGYFGEGSDQEVLAPIKPLTQWMAPSGTGYFETSGDIDLRTQSGVMLLTQEGIPILLNPEVYEPKFKTTWILDSKQDTFWVPPSGTGYITASTGNALTTQSGVDLLTQSGEVITINPDIYIPKSITDWTPN